MTEELRPALLVERAVAFKPWIMVAVLAFRVATIGTAACEAILLGVNTPNAVKRAATRPATNRVQIHPATICAGNTEVA